MFFFKVSDFLVFPHEIAHFMKVVVFFNRKSTGFTAARGVILRAGVFLLVFVFFKHETGHVDSYLFFARCCFNVNTLLQHVLFQSFHGARSQTLLAGCKLDIDSSLIFFKAVKTVCKPGFLLNMTLTCPTPPHPSTYHEHDVNMPHPTPPINVT